MTTETAIQAAADHEDAGMTTPAPLAIGAALHRQGLTTQAQQAEALGERREHWNRYLKGHMAPTAVKLEGWLQAADESGHTLHLTLDPHIGWVCKVAT